MSMYYDRYDYFVQMIAALPLFPGEHPLLLKEKKCWETEMQKDYKPSPASEFASWCLSTSWEERLPLSIAQPELTTEQQEKATQKLAAWLEIFGDDENLYREWLGYSALSESSLLSLFIEEPHELHHRLSSPPAWLQTFSIALEQYMDQDEDFLEALFSTTIPISSSASSESTEEGHLNLIPLLTLVKPFIFLARQRLLDGIHGCEKYAAGSLFNVATLMQSLLLTLVMQLQNMLSRTLVLEYRVAQQQNSFPRGETLQESIRNYAHYLNQRENILAFFSDYPVLARKVIICVEQWCENNREILARLTQDWSTLCKLFSPYENPGVLQQIDSHLGDKHRGGRSVQILVFASGLRLVYKPRSLAIDMHFQELLQWLNNHGQTPTLRTLKILDRQDYGWEEWVEAHDCTSLEEIERFYQRQGANLALLYALEATDFHYENILAVGEYPVLVDLESLMHVQIEGSLKSFGPVERLAYNNVSSSVLRTLLLPYRPPQNANQQWVEISGLGGAPGQIVSEGAFRLSGLDTGDLHFARTQAILPGAKNRPHLCGKDVDIFAYLSQISAGFAGTYRLLLSYRSELSAPGGPLACFANDTTRVVLRATLEYGQLLHTSLHPYLLHNELDQERVRNILWLVTKDQPEMKKVIFSEQEALRQGDIPLFTTQVASRDLWNNAGQRIPDFFTKSGFESLLLHWEKLSEQDLERQLWFIQASFTTLTSIEEKQQTSQITQQPLKENTPLLPPDTLHDELLLAACEIGDRLCQLATQEGESATWLELTQVDEKQWTLILADLSLYSGLAGIILSLAYLGNVTGKEQYTRMARKGLSTYLGRIAYDRDEIKSIGFFAGWGSAIALLTHLATLWQEEALLHQAFTILELLPPLIDQDNGLDLVRGSAGCIASLLCLDSAASSATLESLLIRCGERLAATAMPLPVGIGWQVFKDMPCLTGFAHGGAGFAWSLLKLSQRTGEQRFFQLALDALVYERSLYNPDLKNWRDMRGIAGSNESVYRLAWCYGAPGIGLARLDTLPILNNEEIQAEIQAALETTLAEGFGGTHSLCHGDLGNLELLYRAQHVSSERRWQTSYELIKTSLLENGRRYGWLCGTPQQVETPGLMVGLAGICLQLLRLAKPEHIPSILTMEPPRRPLHL